MQENKFVIFGNPVDHSKSPQMHNAAFKHLNLNNTYETYLIEDGNTLKDVFISENIKASNITLPFKEFAYIQADEVKGIANEIKACNTFINENGKVLAYNTDAPGFMKAISDFDDIKTVLLIGAGGTAKAIAIALKDKNIEVTVINRSIEKLEFFKNKGFKTFLSDNFRLEAYDLIVNSTSVGLKEEKYPVAMLKLENLFLNARYAFDCVYGKETPFLKLAKQENLMVKDGEDMLLYQGVLALELFIGKKIDEETIEVMRKALKQQ
ncbi:MAG: shikimate dehydrogenase [Campylobacteraceae bacterium]|nr:shikimate dehydrogenase [Campylobacteraceae bacterium]